MIFISITEDLVYDAADTLEGLAFRPLGREKGLKA
jgi:hypothetical protein